MIVLDASVVIAHLTSQDAHHRAATAFFRENLDEQFLVHTLTLTEILVGPTRVDRGDFAMQQLTVLGIAEWTPPAASAARLARLRAEQPLKLPDCCVLDAAMVTGSALATFDDRLARVATSLGVRVVAGSSG